LPARVNRTVVDLPVQLHEQRDLDGARLREHERLVDTCRPSRHKVYGGDANDAVGGRHYRLQAGAELPLEHALLRRLGLSRRRGYGCRRDERGSREQQIADSHCLMNSLRRVTLPPTTRTEERFG